MSDTVITSAPVDIIPGGASTVTETPGQQTPVVGSGTELNGESSRQSEPSGSQDSTDDSQGNTGERRGWSKLDEIRELRASRREAREREAATLTELQQLRQQFEQLRQAQQQPRTGKPERDPSKFWQDPEASIQSALDERLERLQESMVERFQTTREEEYAQQALNYERGQAVEFIRSQKGYSQEDDEDLIEIIHENGLSNLSPMQAARAAWSIFQQEKGIGDRSALKAQASGVVGQPPGVGLGKKVWSSAEYERTLDDLMKNPKYLIDHPELEAELMSAQREGRVR